jgi:hypothetical protein
MCLEMLCGVLSVLRHNAVPAFSVFSFDFIYLIWSIYTRQICFADFLRMRRSFLTDTQKCVSESWTWRTWRRGFLTLVSRRVGQASSLLQEGCGAKWDNGTTKVRFT